MSSPAPDELQRIYAIRFSSKLLSDKDRVWMILVTRFFQKWVRSTDTVLDLGCGYGEFLNHLNCARKIGVDLNPDSPSRLEKTTEFHHHTVSALPFLPDNTVDVVFTSNLMEHLPSKTEVNHMIAEALRVLKPGGSFIMMGPNLRFLPGLYWDFWDHIVPITDRSLEEALVNQGFQIAEIYPKFLPYTTTRGRLPNWSILVRAYLAFRPIWGVLGKQFLIRAVKPS